MAKDIESEEECLTNNLQKKLRSIKQEKEQTESEVEDLKKRLDRMRFEQEKVITREENTHIVLNDMHFLLIVMSLSSEFLSLVILDR